MQAVTILCAGRRNNGNNIIVTQLVHLAPCLFGASCAGTYLRTIINTGWLALRHPGDPVVTQYIGISIVIAARTSRTGVSCESPCRTRWCRDRLDIIMPQRSSLSAFSCTADRTFSCLCAAFQTGCLGACCPCAPFMTCRVNIGIVIICFAL